MSILKKNSSLHESAAAEWLATASFETLVRIAFDGKTSGSMKIGNVTFEVEDNCIFYDLPTHKWSGVAECLAFEIQSRMK